MRLLLDTHAAIWALAGDRALSGRARDLLVSDGHEVLLSAVVALEVAVKSAIGKLDLPGDLAEELLDRGAHELPVTIEHARRLQGLPLHHRDPFDRMLIAQALVEDAVILSADARFDAYGVKRRW